MAWIAGLCLSCSAIAQQSAFIGISHTFTTAPPCGGSPCWTFANAISADGSTIVGFESGAFVDSFVAKRWSQSGARLAPLPGESFGIASAVSADGQYIVINYFATGAQPPPLPGSAVVRAGPDGAVPLGISAGTGRGISGDGSIVVGDGPMGAFRWTQAGGAAGLGSLSAAFPAGAANAISRDGQVIVGWATNASNAQEAFRWMQATGMVGLGTLPGGVGNFASEANAVSADGSVIVGRTNSEHGTQAFRWTQPSGIVPLGGIGGPPFDSVARAVSSDGRVVVGRSFNGALGAQAFLWTETVGIARLADVLSTRGVNLTGWTLTDATGISGDGQIVVGNGLSPNPVALSGQQAWIARLGTDTVPAGLTTPASLVQSISNMQAVTLAGARAGQQDMGRTLDAARRVGVRTSPEPVRVASTGFLEPGLLSESHKAEAYLLGSWQSWNYDPLSQGYSPGLTAGASIALAPRWRVGAGVSVQSATDNTVYSGRYRTEGTGAHAFGSWNAGGKGWRALAAVNYLTLDASIRRGYINGAGTATSSGDTDGYTGTVLGRVEYAWALGERLSIAPYFDYAWQRTRLDAYTEDPASGPFPAFFNRQTQSSEVARLGAELAYQLDRQTSFYGWGSYADRVRGTRAAVSGQYLGLAAFDVSDLRVPDDHWLEAGAGFSRNLTDAIRLMGSVTFSTSGSLSRSSAWIATVGLAIGL